jgi:hypothetical protein
VIPKALQYQLAVAQRTKGTADDLKALGRIHDWLVNKLEHTTGDAKRLPLVKALNAVNKAISKIKADQAKSKLKKIHDAFKAMWDQETQRALTAFDKATERGRKALEKLHQARLDAIESERSALTPAEAELAALEDQRQQQDISDAIADAQRQLSEAQTPEEVRDAQRALDDALYQQRIYDLQKRAEAERAVRDKEAEDKTKAEDDAYGEQVQRYEDERKLLREHLQRQLKLYLQYLIKKNHLAKLAGKDLLAFLAAHPEYGIITDDLPPESSGSGSNSTPSGLPQGSMPHLAAGGIVRRPTVALIGEAGAEAVIPLGRGFASPTVVEAHFEIKIDSESAWRGVKRAAARDQARNRTTGLR